MINIDKHIKDAMVSVSELMRRKDELTDKELSMLEMARHKLDTLKMIKAEFVTREKNNETVDEQQQFNIMIKMIEKRKEAKEQYDKAKRADLVNKENHEIEVIESLMPPKVSDEEIASAIDGIIEKMKNEKGAEWKVSIKDTKDILTRLKELYPLANGKIVSEVIKNYNK